MPASAVALVAVFVLVSILAGAGAWWIIGPRRPLALAAPVLTAFGALYLVGHRLGLGFGPTMRLFGFEVALLWDVAVALVAALAAAALQRLAMGRRARAGAAR